MCVRGAEEPEGAVESGGEKIGAKMASWLAQLVCRPGPPDGLKVGHDLPAADWFGISTSFCGFIPSKLAVVSFPLSSCCVLFR